MTVNKIKMDNYAGRGRRVGEPYVALTITPEKLKLSASAGSCAYLELNGTWQQLAEIFQSFRK